MGTRNRGWLSLWLALGCGERPPSHPQTLQARVTPVSPAPGDTLHCQLNVELAGTDARARFRWLRNGEVVGQSSTYTGDLAAGDVMSCEVFARSTGRDARRLRDDVVVHNGRVGQNIVLLILDDVGVERVGAYGVENLAPPTPNLDRLARRGVLFDNAYANPVCSPTRAGILTGLHSQNSGMGTAIRVTTPGLAFSAWTLPEALDELTGDAYHHAAIGKWHISGLARGADNPVEHGFDRFAGTMGNLGDYRDGTYDRWTRLEHGRERLVQKYATTDTVDTVLAYMEELPEPFFLWVGFHAAHTPFHVPPQALSKTSIGPDASNSDKFNAAVTAMDTEIGRLLSSMSAEQRKRTTFLVIGDNGTPQYAAEPPYDKERVKSSVYEGGIRVPLIVSGPMVREPGRRSDALVSHVDLFSTVLELAGVPLTGARADSVDGVSFLGQLSSSAARGARRYVYQESFGPNSVDLAGRQRWSRALRDRRWKYVRRQSGREELYDLRASHLDDEDLLMQGGLDPEMQDALDRLQRVMDLDYAPRPVDAGWW